MKSQGSHPVGYPSETAKIRLMMIPYCTAEVVLDYGCGTDKITEWARGIDIRSCDGVDIVTGTIEAVYSLSGGALQHYLGNVDTIFSSHFLEHVQDDRGLILEWHRLLRQHGNLCLYLPDDDHYDNDNNPEHLHRYRYEDFVGWFRREFSEAFELVNHGPHVGDDLYSFYLVARKK